MNISFQKLNERQLLRLTKDLLGKKGLYLDIESTSQRPQPDLYQKSNIVLYRFASIIITF